MWFHQVESLDDSISANVWSTTKALREYDDIFNLPLPFSENWSHQKLYDATKVFISMVVESYLGPSSATDFVKGMFQTRFKTLDAKHLKKFMGPKDQKYCSTKIDETPLRGEMKRGLSQVRRYLDPLPKELRSVVMEDYIQDLVLFTTGLDKLPGYLEACFP